MKKITLMFVGMAAIALPVASFAAGAGINLYNGGLGQAAANAQSFGVAICNGGTKIVTQAVPVTVSLAGQSVTISSAASINAGACVYSYLAYGQLGMRPGATYTVTVTIDPKRTLISNSNNQTTYTIKVPASQAAGTTNSPANQTANVNIQSGNFFSMIQNLFSHVFGGQ